MSLPSAVRRISSAICHYRSRSNRRAAEELVAEVGMRDRDQCRARSAIERPNSSATPYSVTTVRT